MKKKLLLITSEYPFNNGEAFLESELPYLAQAFASIHIITNYASSQLRQRPVPLQTTISQLPYELSLLEKCKALTYMFSTSFWKEIAASFKYQWIEARPSAVNISTILFALYRGKKLYHHLQALEFVNSTTNLVIYSYWCNDMAVGLSKFKAKHPHVPIYARTHRWELYFEYAVFGKPGLLPLRNYIFNNLDRIFCISEHGQSYLKHHFPKYVEKFALSKLGTMPPPKLNQVYGKFHILSVSSVYFVKRVPLIAEALALLPKDLEICWTHIGTGPDMKLVEELAKHLPAAQLLGSIPNQKVLAFYQEQAVHVLINVSTSEGLPVSMMEAMSFGVPVIGTAVGGVPEIIQHKKNGFLLQENPTAEEIANAILYFYQMDEVMYQGYRQEARRTWEQNFDASRNYPEFAKQISQ